MVVELREEKFCHVDIGPAKSMAQPGSRFTAGDAPALLGLLNAPSKQAVDEFMCECFASRRAGPPDAARKSALANRFGLAPREAERMHVAATHLIGDALYRGSGANETIALFPSDFHADLRALLVKVCAPRAAPSHMCARSLTSLSRLRR